MSPAVMKCDNLHKLCALLVPVPGSGSCIAVSLYRCIAFLVLAEIFSTKALEYKLYFFTNNHCMEESV